MSAILPVRDKVEHLSFPLIMKFLFIHPIGPYWYLHTLIICGTIYYLIFKYLNINKISLFILIGLSYFIVSRFFNLLTFSNALYFLAGVILSQSGKSFVDFFKPSILAIIPLIILCSSPDNLERSSLAGMAITFFVILFLLYLYRFFPSKVKDMSHFIGKNTLSILLFSPVFTMLSKLFLPYFSFDSSGMLYLFFSLILTVAGCLFIVWSMDRVKLSKFFFGEKKMFKGLDA